MEYVVVILFLFVSIVLIIAEHKESKNRYKNRNWPPKEKLTPYNENDSFEFCEMCLDETTEETCGDANSYFFIGGNDLRFMGGRCGYCNSYIVEHRFKIMGITVNRHGRYRIIVTERAPSYPGIGNKKFISRKLKENHPSIVQD